MAYRNKQIPVFLRFLYFLFRVLTFISVHLFYRRRVVLGKEHLRFDGPAIVVNNHPSTLMDVLNPGLHIHQEMYFLANYGLFKHPVSNWVFTRLFCIPVKRKEDVQEGEARDNRKAFEKSYEHLEASGVLFVAPEGTSYMNRFVRPFKNGTARIALGTEERNGFQAGVKIIPIGLSYSAPNLFRSDLVIQVGEPILASDYAQAFAANSTAAYEQLTQNVENRVREQTVDARDEAGELLLNQMEQLVQSEKPVSLKADFFRSKKLLQDFLDDATFKEQIQEFYAACEVNSISPGGMAAYAHRGHIADGIWLLLGLPVFLIVGLMWFLPCFIPAWVNKKMDLYIGYSSTIKILVGLLVFPVVLWGLYKLVLIYTFSRILGLASLPAFFVLGYLGEGYLDVWKRWKARRSVAIWAQQDVSVYVHLEELRQNLLEKMGVTQQSGS
ncbi:MAG: 1-acyl-sn-glycerol-3-phosphate acyltransferase [Saprospiraceae bacterium]